MTLRAVAKSLAVLLLIAVAGLGAGLGLFVRTAWRTPDPAVHADGIVALTGGADRVETAMRLLAADQARVLLVSGVAPGAALSDLARRSGLDPASVASRVTLGRTARTTLGNAEETADWVQTHAIRSLIVVTAGYHMPRALLELQRAMPEILLHPWPVQPDGVTPYSEARLLAEEYVKLLAAWAGLSGLLHQPTATVLRHPGDNSVNG